MHALTQAVDVIPARTARTGADAATEPILSLPQIARQLSMDESSLIQQGLRAYLMREIGVLETEIARLRERYDVVDLDELRQRIESGEEIEHPTWEDSLEWENALDAISDIRIMLRRTPKHD